MNDWFLYLKIRFKPKIVKGHLIFCEAKIAGADEWAEIEPLALAQNPCLEAAEGDREPWKLHHGSIAS